MTEGKLLMVGCRDYPLAVGKMRNGTVYFGTDTETWAAILSVNEFSRRGEKTDDILCDLISIRDSHTRRTSPDSL